MGETEEAETEKASVSDMWWSAQVDEASYLAHETPVSQPETNRVTSGNLHGLSEVP